MALRHEGFLKRNYHPSLQPLCLMDKTFILSIEVIISPHYHIRNHFRNHQIISSSQVHHVITITSSTSFLFKTRFQLHLYLRLPTHYYFFKLYFSQVLLGNICLPRGFINIFEKSQHLSKVL